MVSRPRTPTARLRTTLQDGTDKDGNPLAGRCGRQADDCVDKAAPFVIDYKDGAYTTDSSGVQTFNYHPD